MKEFLKSFIWLKSMFSKLIMSFIVVIIVISSFHFITNQIYKRNMEHEITKNVSERLSSTAREYEQCFNDVKDKLLLDFYIQYSDKIESSLGHGYDNTLMVKMISKYLLMYPYIGNFAVFKKDFDYVITLSGTLEKESYFERSYKSNYYTESFWQEELNESFMYKIYPAKEFILDDMINQSKRMNLMPVVMKNVSGSDFLIIVLIDIDKFSSGFDENFTKDFYIYDSDMTLLYPVETTTTGWEKASLEQHDFGNSDAGYQKVENGYLFKYKSLQNRLIYIKYYPDTIIRDQINKTNSLLTFIILAAMLISIMLSIYIVRKFNNPVKNIYQLIKDSKGVPDTGRDIIDLKNIKERVAGIVSQNTNYERDIDEKNSLLKNYFWQTRLKNIILKPGESVQNHLLYSKYAVILFKIHYRKSYYENIAKETNEGAYVLKDLIDVYIYEEFGDAVTFQVDEKQIVSIVEVNRDTDSIKDSVNRIVHKLKTEDEYVYFTVTYSNVDNNSSQLHEVYEKVQKTQRYRKLNEETQVMDEEMLNNKLDGFIFSKDQQERFTNLLANGRKEECIQFIDGVFDYNLRKEINELCIYLLYVEIIDCCSNVLMQLYNDIPADLPLTNNYFNLGQNESIQDYKNRYKRVISECINYISKNKKQEDYIIDYVKNYINENYASDISVDLLADKLKISRTYLSRYFKNNTGINLSDYLIGFRMKKACALLQNSFLMVKDIAPKVGIYNISTFMRLFRNYTGKTPNDYRKSNIR